MAVHFKELTGNGLTETFTRNVYLKRKRLLDYMNTVCVKKSSKFQQAMTKVKGMRGELSGCSEDINEMALLLLSYFDEKEEAMFSYVDGTCLAREVQLDQVPLTPTIVVRTNQLFCEAVHAECGSKHRSRQHLILHLCLVHDVRELLLLQHPLPIRAGINLGVSAEVLFLHQPREGH